MMGNRKIILDLGKEIPLDRLPGEKEKNSPGITLISGSELDGLFHMPISLARKAIIFDPFITLKPEQLQSLIATEYLPGDEIYFSSDGQAWSPLSIESISTCWQEITFLFLPGKGSETSLEGFQEVIARLRAPGGCPWDRKQTHTTLRPYLLEETYEALDALDRVDIDSLKEELGDLILQIALHAQIAQENMEFQMGDILAGINRKIVFRHPHVFKDWVVDGELQVVQNWEMLKGQERKDNGDADEKGLLDGVPRSYPALAQAQAVQERAARVGFDWKEIAPVLDKVQEELEEIRNARTEEERTSEFGDLLFALVNFIRWNKVDAESALRQTNNKFRKRFAFIEKSASADGRPLKDMTLEEMDVLWEKAKQFDD
jgi:tetrapyrrole methylase family protein / MazG family protein